MNLKGQWRWDCIILGAYFVYFLGLFAWYPLHHTLPGLSDTIYNITIFNDYWNRLSSFITGESLGNALYPERIMQLYLEPYFGQASLYLPFKFLLRDDILSYYAFLSALYALTGYGAFLLFRFLFRLNFVAAILGLCFASSSFLLSQMELLNGIAYFPFFVSLTLFLCYRKSRRVGMLLGGALAAAIQIYFSPYITVYLALVLLCITIYDWIILRSKLNLSHYLVSIIIGVVIIFPYFYFVFVKGLTNNVNNQLAFDLVGNFSFQLGDFFRSLPHNLLYAEEGFFASSYTSQVIKNSNSGFLGIAVYITACLGLFQKNVAVKRFALLLIPMGLILSVGPYLYVNELAVPMPMYFFYKYTFLVDFLRVPARAFSLFILGILLLSGIFLSSLTFGRKHMAVALFGLIFIAENVPLHDDYHPFLSNQLIGQKQHLSFLSEQPKLVTVAHLPSSIYSGKQYSEQMLSEFNREYIYAYWQTKHGKNIINGPCNFCPQSRMASNDLLMNPDDPIKLNALITENNLDYILFHPELVLDQRETELLPGLLNNELLETLIQNDSLVIFKPVVE